MVSLFVRRYVYGLAMFSCFVFHGQKNLCAQGCSDAGFCTMRTLKPTSQVDSMIEAKNQAVFGISRGLGDYGIFVTIPYVEYSRVLSAGWSISGKVGYLFANGEWNTQGFSDLYLNTAYAFRKNVKGTLGFKIPFNDGNLQKNGMSLPMNYQTSLGTFDMIAGLSYYPIKGLGLTAAVQQPLTQNHNQYISPDGRSPYTTTNGYHRKGDVLFRANYQFALMKNKLELTAGLLPIYHLEEDSYKTEGEERITIVGSQGLTLNGNLFLVYHVRKKQAVELSYGMPFLTRKSRPDGLTREYVFGAEYKVSF